MRRPGTSDIAAFLAIIEHGSFRRAAIALNLSPSALSHALRGLEERVGVRLLNRTTRSIALTEAGERLLREVGPAMQTIEQAMTGLKESGDELAGRIRISAPEVGVKLLLRSAVTHFAEHHPRVEIEIVTDNAFVDIVAAGFDAGVRLHEAVPQDMIAVPIGPDAGLIAVATKEYLAVRPAPRTPSDLQAHRCIRFRMASGAMYRWEFGNQGHSFAIDPPGTITLNNMNNVVEAALEGVGVGFVWSYMVDGHIAAGRLEQVLADWSPTYAGPCFYYPSRKNLPRPLTEFITRLRRQSVVVLTPAVGGLNTVDGVTTERL